TRKAVWDEENLLLETDQSDVTQVTYTLEPSQYGRFVSQKRGVALRYYHFDGIGSTDRLSDSTASITDTYIYFAYGSQQSSTGVSDNPWRFIGEYGYHWDSDLNQYYVPARNYDSTTGRFYSRDAFGLAYLANPYSYSDNSPVT